ncbi:MAG: LbtU family siderophore porin, partial [Gammaproteobacteria bacterium]|nr:LbtU family siderophore porin [Gammaproteobacteria bacterium]
TAGFYVFNPELGEGADEDKATAFGLTLGYGNDTFSAGIDYISSIAETDGVEGYLTDPGGLGLGNVVEQVAGLSAHASFSMDAFSMIFEYVGAMDQFDATEISFNGVGAEPSAMNLEFAINVPMGSREATVAVAYQATDEAIDLGLPETRTMIAFSTEVYESTSLGIEYFRDSDYSVTDGGSDETSDTFTVQLATEF